MNQIRISRAAATLAAFALLALARPALAVELELQLDELPPGATAPTRSGPLAAALTRALQAEGHVVVAGAPILVTGRVRAEVASGTPVVVKVESALRVVSREDGAILGVKNQRVEGSGATAAEAATKAVEALAPTFVQAFAADLAAEAGRERRFVVVVTGLKDYGALSRLKGLVQKVEGVGEASSRGPDKGVAAVEVTCRCDRARLRERLELAAPAWTVSVSNTTAQLDMSPKRK